MKDLIFVKTYCAIFDDEKIIMTQDKEGQRGWKLPGGHVEENELIQDALKREVMEEIGIEIEVGGVLLIEDYFNTKRPGEHDLNMFFLANKVGGELKPREDEVEKIQSFTLEQISLLKDVYPSHKNAIKRLAINDFSKVSLADFFIEK